jgi:aminoglycoside phosphotransferase (APT) family kinase protein
LIEHADAMVATVYKVEKPGKSPLILKISSRPNDTTREVYFLKHFAGIIPVPQLVRHEKSALLMECLQGNLLNASDLTESLAYELGSILARIHVERTLGFGDLTQPETLSNDPKLSFTEKFEEGMKECENHLDSSLLNKCRSQFYSFLPLLEDCDGPCIVHRDFRPGNIIMSEGKVQGVIDWASARSGFAEEDFSSFEDHLWGDQSKGFLKGYASIRTVPDFVRIQPLLRLNKAIASIGFTVKRGTWNGKDASFYEKYRNYLLLST